MAPNSPNSSNCRTRLHGNSLYITSHHITSFLISIGLPPPKCQGGSRALGARVCRAHPPAAQQVPGAQSAGDGAREWRKMLVLFKPINRKLSHLSRLECHRTIKIFTQHSWQRKRSHLGWRVECPESGIFYQYRICIYIYIYIYW
jgi:hypothetical protein